MRGRQTSTERRRDMAKTKAKTVQFLVTLDVPEGATIASVQRYVKDAVRTWHGSLEPAMKENDYEGDPMFNLNARSVKVERVKAKSTK